jgi:putative membrane protein
MLTAARALTVFVVLLHLYFLVLEMFLWTTPYGRRVFGLTPEKAELMKTLAMNQGLYNGFLAVGLAWGLVWGGVAGTRVQIFFLGCVIVAGVFGAATAGRRILFVQALPAAVALTFTLLARS